MTANSVCGDSGSDDDPRGGGGGADANADDRLQTAKKLLDVCV